MEFIINTKLPSLNDYTKACRGNKYAGNKYKKDIEELIGFAIKEAKRKGTLHPTEKPIFFTAEWHESTKRRDPDNIVFAKKFIFDALQDYGIIPNDNQTYVKGFHEVIKHDSRDFVKIELKEIEYE